MRVKIADAETLSRRVLEALGYSPAEADTITRHLIDCELRGLGFSGLARIVSIAERLAETGPPRRSMSVERASPVSARIDGGDTIGYLVGQRATELAIDKARASGLALVGASDTWYTGMLSFYAEQATAKGLAVMIASNAAPWVAPHGGSEPRFGTNPICFGFPGEREPVIWDIGTSRIIHAQALLAKRLGHPLPEGVALAPDGTPTTDPAAALMGAFAPWGGHRGGGLAIVVQLLGMMAGSDMMPEGVAGFGMVALAIRPDLLGPEEEFRRKVSAYADVIRDTRPLDGGEPVRMPFDRSREDRARRLSEGAINVPDEVIDRLGALA